MKHYSKSTASGSGHHLISFEARFASPVKPNDKLDISLWDIGLLTDQQLWELNRELEAESGGHGSITRVREIRFVVKVAGRVVLSDGRALLDESGLRERGSML